MFLIFSWVNYFAIDNNMYAGIVLMLAGAYKLCDVLPAIWKEVKSHDKKCVKNSKMTFIYDKFMIKETAKTIDFTRKPWFLAVFK